MLIYFEGGFRSCHVFDIEVVGQSFAKLLAFKVGGLEKSLLPCLTSKHMIATTPSGSESFSKFADGKFADL